MQEVQVNFFLFQQYIWKCLQWDTLGKSQRKIPVALLFCYEDIGFTGL